MNENCIKVLVAEGSATSRSFLVQTLESDAAICVVGAVADGQGAVDFVRETKPDVVLMEIHLPGLDGFEATRCIMETVPVPIIICSTTTNLLDVLFTFRAMEAGAVACVEKPRGGDDPESRASVAKLLAAVKLMSEVRVVRRWSKTRAPVVVQPPAPRSPARISMIGIGTSTGGPPVLQTIFTGLPKDFSVPILVVQHIASSFLPGMVEWLAQTTGFRVQIASHGIRPQAGSVYLAPDDFHMGVASSGEILLTREPPEAYLRPSVSYLFRSLAKTYGPNLLGVLLTGMGSDGAKELKAMKDQGATTIAQDRASSVVHGMPGEAIALGAASYVLPADKIASALVALVDGRKPVAG